MREADPLDSKEMNYIARDTDLVHFTHFHVQHVHVARCFPFARIVAFRFEPL